ncbi:MAG: hypothetical protein RI907_1095 [Pseudomonadota bacterium]|jgi:DNA-binding MarR family transcriptional regulator
MHGAGVNEADGSGPQGQGSAQSKAVLRQFRVIFGAVRAHFHEVEKQTGVGGAQLWALSAVAAQPDMGMGDLAEAMDIHQSTASNLVRGLVQKGLLLSRRADADRRQVCLTVTPQGRQILQKVPGPVSGVLADVLAQMDGDVLARLHADLGQLIGALGQQADVGAAKTPLAEL